MYVKPLVFSIARTSLHDGDGIRTVVYLKGCNMRCRWCHNPEGLKSENEIIFNHNKCIGCDICTSLCTNVTKGQVNRKACVACGVCQKQCLKNAVTIFKGCYAQNNLELCIGCGLCAKLCPAGCITIGEVQL